MTFWFIFVAILPLVIVSMIVYYQRVQSIKAEAFNKLIAIRDLKVNQLNTWLDERIGDIRTISNDFEIRAVGKTFNKLERTSDDTNIINTASMLLNQYTKNYRAYNELFIINPLSGKVELSTNKSSEGLDKSKDDYFTTPIRTRNIYIKDIYYSKTLRTPSMSFSAPIYSDSNDENIIGILVARIDLGPSLYQLLLERTGMGSTGETLIVNKDMVALNELRWYARAPLRLTIKAKPAVLASQGNTGIIEITDYRNEEVLAAYTHIPRTKWGFVSKQDLKEIYAPIGTMLQQILALLLISAAGVYLVAFFIARKVAQPLVTMTDVSKRIQAGELSARNQVIGADELGFLAQSFNDMADSVMSQISVQQGVAEVTETMVAAGEIKEFGADLIKKLLQITDSNLGAIYLLSASEDRFDHLASMGVNPELLEPFDAAMLEGEFGRALSTKKITHIKNIAQDTVFKFKTFTGTALPKEIITIPVIATEKVKAILSLASLNEYSKEALEILEQLRLVLNTGFANLLANEEVRELARDLDAKNQELTDLADELKLQSDELQEQNVELEIQRKQVEEANRLKSEFLSNMSHELRTPLNSIMALSRVLILQAKQQLSEEQAGYLEIIERNGKQLLALINDILDLSKIEAGRMDVSPKLFAPGSTIETIVENLEPVAEEKGIEIIQKLPDQLPKIESDEARVHHILQNIISNAVKFTKKGRVTVSAASNEQTILISVTDTGIGISEKDLPHIFDEFRQVDGSSSRSFEGTGLGLTIAYKSAKMLGGEITVESSLGAGSTFTVSLPLEWQGIVPIYEPITETPSSETIRLERKTIIVVDDEPDVAKMISDYLSEEGYNTITATSGEQALKLAEIHKPFAITLDILMPEMDGLEVLQNLKKNPETADIPVIIVSISNDRETGLALGAVGYITKPVNKDALISEIKEIKKILTKIEKLPEHPRLHKSIRGNRILLVEDNEVAIIQVKSTLEDQGYIVDVARGGEEAIKYVEHRIPDGIILDLMMPGVDGFEVLEKIRSADATAKIPVLILTAKDLTAEDMERLQSNNIQELIQKGDVDRKSLLIKTDLMMGSQPKLVKPELVVKAKKPAKPAIQKKAPIEIKKKKRKSTILVIEDNPDNMTTIKAILQDRYEILEAFNGEVGLQTAFSEIPDLVLLDMSLPKVDGFTVVRKIKEADESGHIPVIALTARAMKGDRERMIDAGCDDYIAKPIDPEKILEKIDKWLSK